MEDLRAYHQPSWRRCGGAHFWLRQSVPNELEWNARKIDFLGCVESAGLDLAPCSQISAESLRHSQVTKSFYLNLTGCQ